MCNKAEWGRAQASSGYPLISSTMAPAPALRALEISVYSGEKAHAANAALSSNAITTGRREARRLVGSEQEAALAYFRRIGMNRTW